MLPKIYHHFARYASVGVLNTALHWCIFLFMHFWLEASQAISNLIAFGAASTMSFFVNAYWTFKSSISFPRYISFVGFLGSLSYVIGHLGDVLLFWPLLTLIVFSALSLVLGFAFSHWAIFKDKR